MNKIFLGNVALLTGVLAIPAGAATIYTNDLGTIVQQNALLIDNRRSDKTVTYANDYPTPYPYVDLDGDGLVNNAAITASGWEQDYLYKDFYAPVFQTYSAPEISASGSAASSFATNVGVQIEKTGATAYSTMLNPSGTVSAGSPQVLHASTDADLGYQRIKRFKTALVLVSSSGSIPDVPRRPRIGNMSVSAAVNDAQAGDNVYIYKNDFGTAAQVGEFSLTGQSVTTTSMPLTDVDQDNLGGRLTGNTAAPFTTTLIRRIDAPAGMVFSNPFFTALAYGNKTNLGTDVTIALSADGIDFDDVSAITGTGPASFALVADSSGNTNFESLTSVWAQIKIYAGNANVARPWIENVLVSADVTAVPEPASVGLLMLGGLMMIRRRRK